MTYRNNYFACMLTYLLTYLLARLLNAATITACSTHPLTATTFTKWRQTRSRHGTVPVYKEE